MATEKQVKALERAAEKSGKAFDQAAEHSAPNALELYAEWKRKDTALREAYKERGLLWVVVLVETGRGGGIWPWTWT